MQPSDFTAFPLGSVLDKCEAEVIAIKIMKILSRTGNTFRKLTFEEYRKEREKDGNFEEMLEYMYFKRVWPYCKSAEDAMAFSKVWKNAANQSSPK